MGQRRSKLDRHGAELLALRRAGANVAQLTRWLRFQRGTVVAATTVGRWLDNAHAREIDRANGFDAVAALDELRARNRALRFPRLAVSRIDEHGYHVLRLRREGATNRRVPPGAARRARAARRPIHRVPLAQEARQWRVAVPAAAGTSRATGSGRGPPIRRSRPPGS